MLSEIYSALHANSGRLVIMGVRSIIERVMIEKVGDHRNFGKNLEQFQSAGYLSPISRQFLETAIEAGHAAIHREHKLEDQHVISVIDILEHLLETVYVLPKVSENIKAKILERTSKRKSGGGLLSDEDKGVVN